MSPLPNSQTAPDQTELEPPPAPPEIGETIESGKDKDQTTQNPQVYEELSGLFRTLCNKDERGVEVHEVAGKVSFELSQFGVDATTRNLTEAIKNHPCFSLEKSGVSPETLALEVMQIEHALLAPLLAQIEASGVKPEPGQVEQGLNCVREMLYGIVLNGLLSGEKIQDLIGQIYYQPQANTGEGGEAHGETFDANQIDAYFHKNNEGKYDIHLYGKFFEAGVAPQLHLLRHEFAHLTAEGTNMWEGQTYDQFLILAQNIDRVDLNKLRAQGFPGELCSVLQAIAEPGKHKEIWNSYARKRLEKLAATTGADELVQERQNVARELVAEMIAPYLRSGADENGYFASRFQFNRPQDIFKYLQRELGCEKDDEKFREILTAKCAECGVTLDPQTTTPQELLDSLASVPEFALVFAANKEWSARLGGALAKRGENLQVGDRNASNYIDEDELDEFGDMEDFGSYSPSTEGLEEGEGLGGSGSAGSTKGSKEPKNIFEAIWDFFTGTNKKSKMSAAKIPGLPKAA